MKQQQQQQQASSPSFLFHVAGLSSASNAAGCTSVMKDSQKDKEGHNVMDGRMDADCSSPPPTSDVMDGRMDDCSSPPPTSDVMDGRMDDDCSSSPPTSDVSQQ